MIASRDVHFDEEKKWDLKEAYDFWKNELVNDLSIRGIILFFTFTKKIIW